MSYSSQLYDELIQSLVKCIVDRIGVEKTIELVNNCVSTETEGDTIVHAVEEPPKQRRGRKPGVLPDSENRCKWKSEEDIQCKNKRCEGGHYCGIHKPKANIIIMTSAVTGSYDSDSSDSVS